MPALPKNILIIRNDKLGDFMLAWPAFQLVKQAFPESTIYALVPEYTKPMAMICPWIDKIIIDNEQEGFYGLLKTTSKIKSKKIDTVLNLHSTPRIALTLFLARIKHRFAPASRIDQIFYNHTLTQRRSRSEKPEYEYNTELAIFMANYFNIKISYSLTPPLLKFPEQETQTIKDVFYKKNNIEKKASLVFVHAGSGGSASNLSIEQYAELITALAEDDSLFFVLTAGPNEETIAQRLSEQIQNCNHIIHYSNQGIIEYAKLLSIANMFISGSTGTLHLAGALNIKTAAFYPKRKSATLLRWETINEDTNRIAFSLDDNKGMLSIDINKVSSEIAMKLSQ
ncbi:MAG: glycosyltransferase family 9 protein [Gammaproteobacteria bacterium]|nr:glycosyltransferase family 9 protein [Gammaproteobacteria bacterium]MCW8922094.1 glycosyltransferase family 9 protein [Gammaproteobacteria bacterium]